MIPKQLLRRSGYHEFVDPNTRKVSYVRSLQPAGFYPRFHAYLEEESDGFVIQLHLDQKQASYRGSHMHSGEYDGETVEQEGRRIQSTIEGLRMK